MRNCIAGIDVGTSKLAVVLVDSGTGEVVGSADGAWDGYLRIPEAGIPGARRRELDPARMKEVFFATLRRALGSEPGACEDLRLLSIGVTGQMHGVIGLDARLEPCTNAVTWQDERGEETLESGRTILNEMRDRGAPEGIASGYGIVTLFSWLLKKEAPALSRICSIPDYFGMLLGGARRVQIEPGMAESLGAYDCAAGSWASGALRALGVKEAYFPDLAAASAAAGDARRCGELKIPGSGAVPVTVSIGDNQASFIGSVRAFFKTLLVNIGTGSQVSFAVKDYAEARALPEVDGLDVTVRPFVRGAYLVAGSALSGGVVYRTLKDFFMAAGRELFGVQQCEEIYEKMEKAGAGSRDGGGLSVYPLFAGRRGAPEARGRIEGIGLENFTPANLIYGVLLGECEILKEMVNPAVSARIERLVGSGNGIRKNTLLRGVLSCVFERELYMPLHEEEAAYGAALHGAVSAGFYRDYEEAGSLIKYME